jgi:hypothetical protein
MMLMLMPSPSLAMMPSPSLAIMLMPSRLSCNRNVLRTARLHCRSNEVSAKEDEPWMSRPPGRAVDISMEEETAIRWRISQLRSDISRAEREVDALKVTLGRSKRPGLVGIAARASETLVARFDKSFTVLKRQVEKQADPIGFLALDTLAGLRLASNFSLAQRYLLQGPSLVTHSPAIYSRIALLEPYAPGLVSVVERWLPVIEPHLDEILDRLDDIEPHLLYIIDHIDTLAPHCGALLRHLDALLLYAEDKAWLPELIEYVPFYAPRLDALG